jgi:hypothetical protein
MIATSRHLYPDFKPLCSGRARRPSRTLCARREGRAAAARQEDAGALEIRIGGIPAEAKGQPGVRFTTADGRIGNLDCLDIADGPVQAIRGVVNPDKLRYLCEVADIRAFVHEARNR